MNGTVPIGLSTASVYPESTATAFRRAAELGYDGVEVFVWTDSTSRSADELDALMQTYQLPVISVHSPCVLMTSRVWSTDPVAKLARSVDLAETLGASVVVTHPPFVWQRQAGADFSAIVAELQSRTDVRIAVENMFPARVRGQEVSTYRPHWDPSVGTGHAWYTLDLSHTATAGVDALTMADRMGERMTHLHLTDGTGSALDEHLVPGRGGQPCGELLERLARTGFDGTVVVEISTRKATPAARELDLAEALGFARLHWAPGPVVPG
ncbi:sugar phosphate isomerase/epimerase family protein [Nakamurella deserti]|uniref:sugar phosphate isomerase/epimerase family protein n=1 Tax=Nakamurella deserti TaxID=2164074 RepID=UPI000DBE8A84|nr:sugar phosphate isomerase/epimerase [Nakamurella deserti]